MSKTVYGKSRWVNVGGWGGRVCEMSFHFEKGQSLSWGKKKKEQKHEKQQILIQIYLLPVEIKIFPLLFLMFFFFQI